MTRLGIIFLCLGLSFIYVLFNPGMSKTEYRIVAAICGIIGGICWVGWTDKDNRE